MTPQELISSLQTRYATKQFDPSKKVSDDLLSTLVESLVLTPSSFGLQPWKFIIVSNQSIKEQLLPHSWNQAQVTDCSHHIVLCAKTKVDSSDVAKLISHTAETRGVEVESLQMYSDLMNGFISKMDEAQISTWARNQVYIALGQLMASAAALGVDACPMEGITPAEYDNILGLTDSDYQTVVACPIGYRSADDKYASAAKVRFPAEQVVELR